MKHIYIQTIYLNLIGYVVLKACWRPSDTLRSKVNGRSRVNRYLTIRVQVIKVVHKWIVVAVKILDANSSW
jgi:hypothetical protein